MPTRRRILDVAVPCALAVAAAAETVANASLTGDRAVTATAVLLLVAAVALRRTAPQAAAAGAGVVLGASALLGGHAHDESFVAVVCELVLGFTVAARLGTVPAMRGGAALLGGLLLAIGVRGNVFDAMLATIVFGATWAAGRMVHRLRTQSTALAAVSAQLAAERDRTAADAALAERARIARDLHDVVAHHVSVMVVQAGGARGVLRADAAAAEQALCTVERTGRAALVEMRRLLGVLRDDDAARHPQPRLDDAMALLGSADRWDVEGRPVPLEPGLDLTAFRLLQEALTNVRRHGSGPAVVQVSWLPDRLHLDVVNDCPATTASAGHGLRGMVERAALYGGTVTAGPNASQRWRVHTVLPLSRVPADV